MEALLQTETIIERLAAHVPETMPVNHRGHAAVALVLKEVSNTPELLFIVRAEHDRDPWSGNIGFPGGRLEPGKETPRQAAEREAMEELALDLSGAAYLGRLNDLYGTTLPVMVSCFVYLLRQEPKLLPNHEVAKTFWCPLTTLLESERHRESTFSYRGMTGTHPVVDLLSPDEPVLWGITYRLVRGLFTLCDVPFGPG